MKRAISPSSWVLLTAFVALVAGRGCKPNTRDNPAACNLPAGDTKCPAGQRCDADHYMCVPDDAGVGGQGVAGGDGTGGAATGGNAGDAGSSAGGVGASGGSTGLGGTPADGGMDAPSSHCESVNDCAGKTGTLACDMMTSTCVECTDDLTCSGKKPACNANTCVECTIANTTACVGNTAVCEPTKHQCVECLGDGDCKTAEKSFCSKNVCVGCADASACKARDGSKPVCAASGACVACDTDKDCHGTTPFCGPQKTCVPCDQASPPSTCAGLNAGTPFCGASGACVACLANTDCGSATAPFCSSAGACVGCMSAPASQSCMTLTPTKPVCSMTSGACVECVGNSDCPDAKPVCSASNSCGVCTTDSECAGRGPAVCMSHLDGRCASAKETIYVQNNASCSDSASPGGTSMTPFCSMQPATAAVTAARALVVVRGTVSGAASPFASTVSIVGQSSGTIAGTVNPALHISSGTTYARDVKLSTFDSIGLQADSGSTVQLNHVLVTGNVGQSSDSKGGGILLDGAAFDIRNTTVTNNGPGASGSSVWGGILVNNPPSAGPKSLQLVTVQGNGGPGIACTNAITATGVLATGNTTFDVVPACGITTCPTASMTCGAQP